tara:strand:+ start:684 stop:1883 length:1200 start_codon:yes stop_codon:yes gene_type:complete
MTKENNNLNFDTYRIPENAVFLDLDKNIDQKQSVIDALKKVSDERKIDLNISQSRSFLKSNNKYFFNGFSVYVVSSGIMSDEVFLNLKILSGKNSPQIVLLAHIDEENEFIWFRGILTNNDLSNLSNKKTTNQKLIIPTNEFKGGIDSLLTIIQFLDVNALDNIKLTKKVLEKQTIDFSNKIFSNIFKPIPIGIASISALVLGPNIISPQLRLASIPPQEISILPTLRSSISIKDSKICLISPFISSFEKNIGKSEISFDQPLIFSKTPLKKITILSNGEIIYQKQFNEEVFSGPINWQLEPLKRGKTIILRITPNGSSNRQYAEIEIKTLPNNKFIELERLTNSLGDSKRKWIKSINNNIKNDRDLGLALLFSKKAPEIKTILNARKFILENDNCPKY